MKTKVYNYREATPIVIEPWAREFPRFLDDEKFQQLSSIELHVYSVALELFRNNLSKGIDYVTKAELQRHFKSFPLDESFDLYLAVYSLYLVDLIKFDNNLLKVMYVDIAWVDAEEAGSNGRT